MRWHRVAQHNGCGLDLDGLFPYSEGFHDPVRRRAWHGFGPGSCARGGGRHGPYVASIAWGTDWLPLTILLIGLAAGWMLFWISRGRRQAATEGTELNRMQEALARHVERLRILQEIDQALIADKSPEAIAGAVIQPLRETARGRPCRRKHIRFGCGSS